MVNDELVLEVETRTGDTEEAAELVVVQIQEVVLDVETRTGEAELDAAEVVRDDDVAEVDPRTGPAVLDVELRAEVETELDVTALVTVLLRDDDVAEVETSTGPAVFEVELLMAEEDIKLEELDVTTLAMVLLRDDEEAEVEPNTGPAVFEVELLMAEEDIKLEELDVTALDDSLLETAELEVVLADVVEELLVDDSTGEAFELALSEALVVADTADVVDDEVVGTSDFVVDRVVLVINVVGVVVVLVVVGVVVVVVYRDILLVGWLLMGISSFEFCLGCDKRMTSRLELLMTYCCCLRCRRRRRRCRRSCRRLCSGSGSCRGRLDRLQAYF